MLYFNYCLTFRSRGEPIGKNRLGLVQYCQSNGVIILIYWHAVAGIPNCLVMTQFTVQSSFKLTLPPHLIITASSIKLNEIIGQGSYIPRILTQ